MRRPDLIVPIRDRRKRKRILTLKNLAIAMLVCFLGFVAISMHSEMRGLGPVDYGGYETEPLPTPPKAETVEVIPEAPPSTFVYEHLGDATPADRDGGLKPAAPRLPPPSVTSGDHVAIVGGPEGVAIVHQERRRPTLSGGFGRPH